MGGSRRSMASMPRTSATCTGIGQGAQPNGVRRGRGHMAVKAPSETNVCGMAARAPRCSAGAVSAMYTGTTAPAIPMATPVNTRARTSLRAAPAVHRRSDPAMETMDAKRSVARRPSPSASRAAEAVPHTEPMVVPVTMRPSSFGLEWRANSGERERSAPPTMPV
eukprot:scaffold42802_cov31-Tisochrysis_lutea.AAC.10